MPDSRITDELLIQMTKVFFDYLTQYGSNNCPSPDGLHCYEKVIKQGETKSEINYGQGREFYLSKGFASSLGGGDFLTVAFQVNISAMITHHGETDEEEKR